MDDPAPLALTETGRKPLAFGAIVGIIVGVVVAVAIFCLLLIRYRRAKRSRGSLFGSFVLSPFKKTESHGSVVGTVAS
jgi:Na+/H+ antiporter NhaA